jgi:hypothetical protein
MHRSKKILPAWRGVRDVASVAKTGRPSYMEAGMQALGSASASKVWNTRN